jgi:phage recombination protein Bet
MSSAIAQLHPQPVQPVPAPQWNPGQITLLKEQICPGATDQELVFFGEVCARTGLDPFQRQIYFVKRKKPDGSFGMTIQMGIDGFRLQAVRSDRYAGNDDPVFDEGLTRFEMIQQGRKQPTTATATVWAIVGGQRCPFTATVEWEAYYPGDKQGFMWKKLPFSQLGKCAESAALRKAFPAETSGFYTSEEMAQAGPGDIPAQNDNSKLIKAAFDAQLAIHPDDQKDFFFEASGGKMARDLTPAELNAVLEKIKNPPAAIGELVES